VAAADAAPASTQRPEEPKGDEGQQLHQWALGDDPPDREVLTAGWPAPGPSSPGGASTTLSQLAQDHVM
jgi:hypothetical protein